MTEVTLAPEALTELREVAHAWVDKTINDDLLVAVVHANPDLAINGMRWGFQDAEVRESFADACAQFLLNRNWLRFGDNENIDVFSEKLRAAVEEWQVNHAG